MMFEASSRFSIGASVRQGPDFEYRSRFFGGPAHAQTNSPLSNTLIDEDEGILFHVPDSYAVGVRYRHSGNLSIALEYNRVQYSQILNGDGNGQAVETAGQLESNDPIVREEGRKTIAGLALSDSNQIRFGGEWFASGPEMLVRFGTWYDPDHRVRFTDASLPKAVLNTPKGSDEFHFSAGLGKDFGKFRVDGAFDLSPRLNTFSVTTVVYLR
jgi:hypothetical protein